MKSIDRSEHKAALILRLKRIEGQLRGIQRLIEEEAPCESVAQQLSAARRALDKAHHTMVGCLIESQLAERGVAPAEYAHGDAVNRAVADLSRTDRFEYPSRVDWRQADGLQLAERPHDPRNGLQP